VQVAASKYRASKVSIASLVAWSFKVARDHRSSRVPRLVSFECSARRRRNVRN